MLCLESKRGTNLPRTETTNTWEVQLSDKVFVDAQTLLLDSFCLGAKVYKSGFIPTCILAIWRGGGPIALAILEVLRYKGLDPHHSVIRAESYSAMSQKHSVLVEGIEETAQMLNSEDKVLIVDDIFDTGRTVEYITGEIKKKTRKSTPQIKTATVFFNKEKNKTQMEPDYYIRKVNSWVVFPHELEGLSPHEIAKKGESLLDILK